MYKMRNIVPEAQIEEELLCGFKPPVFDAHFSNLPFNQLGDREFEILVYSLLNEEIKQKKHPYFTKIALMQGVGERGRDCVLYDNQGVCGLIQCKKYSGRLTKPQILKELIKFALYSILDNSILPNIDSFKYIFYVSNDFTEPSLNLLFNNSIILDDIENNIINKYIIELVEEYESFRPLRDNPPFENIYNILRRLKISGVNGSELTSRIQILPTILQSFFNIKLVVDLDNADTLIRKALDDYGLKFLTDDDLKFIKDRIDHTPVNQRIGFGFVDFYGFNIEFFQNLNATEFGEILKAIVDFQNLLNTKLVDLASKKIHSSILNRVTKPLVYTNKIRPISASLCGLYLVKRVFVSMLHGGVPESFKFSLIKEVKKTDEEIYEEIINKLLATSKKMMNGDYSELVGDEEDLAKKKLYYKHLHEGVNDIEELRKQIYLDLIILKPILKEIEKDLKKLFSEKRSIMITDTSFLDDKEKIKKTLDNSKEVGKST
ncbi:TPA: hypothetical protein ACXI7T_002282 [Acinetobacter nosocomialis]|uniref:hypothetical protein n=2 Tax=Acinetobacter baumannii TaxID=470 RepID=UPI00044CF950|nr:hypothetical protein [Acinetobacter baumannii]EXB42289.1 hypothetical protein J544_1580 [Acinetobacter baumannii 1461963]MCZ6923231.1 hypothetical protein [Acinetobacter baumannii]